MWAWQERNGSHTVPHAVNTRARATGMAFYPCLGLLIDSIILPSSRLVIGGTEEEQ